MPLDLKPVVRTPQPGHLPVQFGELASQVAARIVPQILVVDQPRLDRIDAAIELADLPLDFVGLASQLPGGVEIGSRFRRANLRAVATIAAYAIPVLGDAMAVQPGCVPQAPSLVVGGQPELGAGRAACFQAGA